MKSSILILMLLIGFNNAAVAQVHDEPSGHISGDCGEEQSKLRDETVLISEAHRKVVLYAEVALTMIEELAEDVEIDVSGLRQWLSENVPDGMLASRIEEWISEKIQEFADNLEKAVEETISDIVSEFREKLTEELERFAPKAKLWSTNIWEENCCDKGRWLKPNGKITGVHTVDISVDIEGKINAGVSVGGEANAPIVIGGGGALKLSLKSLSPITPENGAQGSSISIDAVPNFDLTIGRNLKAGALVIVSVKTSITGAGELEPENVVLNCVD